MMVGRHREKEERKNDVSKCLLQVLTRDKGSIRQGDESHCVLSLEAEGRHTATPLHGQRDPEMWRVG